MKRVKNPHTSYFKEVAHLKHMRRYSKEEQKCLLLRKVSVLRAKGRLCCLAELKRVERIK